jgi:hypothetical protein
MMKRLVPILFIVFYTVSVIGLSIERTEAWVAEHTRDAKHGQSRQGARIGEWHRRSTRDILHSKLLEDGSVLASPFVSTHPQNFETALHQFFAGFVVGQIAQVVSSRAPPTLIS